MKPLDGLTRLIGKWSGKSRLWLSPDEPPRTSESIASVVPAGGHRFVRIDYTWAFDGKSQEGSLLLGYEKEREVVTAVWIDSWHMSDKILVCEGAPAAGGAVSVKGSYAAPPGPDWGWRTVVEPRERDSFRMIMYNVSPDGQEDLAVEAEYARQR